MNPLSAWTYHRRHKRQALLLLGLSVLGTVALYSLVALVWAVFVEPPRQAARTYSEFSMVTPGSAADGAGPSVVARLEANLDIARFMPATVIRVDLPSIMAGDGFQFELLGLMEGDVRFLLERFGASLADGRLLEPGAAELLLSRDVARMLHVEVGDSYVVTSAEFYGSLDTRPQPTTFRVVGILESDIDLGIASLEFLNGQEQYRGFPARLLVVARDGRKEAVDGFLRGEILTPQTAVMTGEILNERILGEALPGLVMLLPVVLIVAIAFSLVIVVVYQLANTRRLPEFGILHATGRSKRWLASRLTVETTTLALAGWALGIGLSYLGLYLLKVTLFAARGHDLSYLVWLPVVFSLPVPAAIAGFTFLTSRRTLGRLDPVAIVERRELSAEAPLRSIAGRGRKKLGAGKGASSAKPLSPATFYQRRRRRALGLVAGMGVMILAVVLFIFARAVDAGAHQPFLGYLNRVAVVRSPGVVHSLDPAVAARVQAHPAVERAIPVAPRVHILSARIPPFSSTEASPFAVYAPDMAYLVELYGLELLEGSLPRPGSNEMVIPQALARNRDLHVGDVIGSPNAPAYPGASSLPAEFVVSGIFAPPPASEDGSGLAFISLEFLEERQPFPLPERLPLMVVPRAGQKQALDRWLETELAGAEASVLTHGEQLDRLRQKARQDMVGMALLETVIALVAAAGLAVLNYVFVSQRQAEFGILHALGYGRRRLVGRVVGETAFITAVAWGLSALAALAALLCLRFALFQPLGLTFNPFDPTPWLVTLPIPVIVLVVTAATTARTLSQLDPLAIIEGRR